MLLTLALAPPYFQIHSSVYFLLPKSLLGPLTLKSILIPALVFVSSVGRKTCYWNVFVSYRCLFFLQLVIKHVTEMCLSLTGVSIETMKDFVSKWRHVWQSKGWDWHWTEVVHPLSYSAIVCWHHWREHWQNCCGVRMPHRDIAPVQATQMLYVRLGWTVSWLADVWLAYVSSVWQHV
jgi:hypothetical protein